MNKIALFDLDDTLIDLKETLYHTLRMVYGERVDHWSLWGSFSVNETIGISTDELMEVCIEHKVFRKIQPNLFAPYILKDLKVRGWHVAILTAREGFVPNAYDETAAYLAKHDMPYDNLLITRHGEDKSEALGEYEKIDFTIDDQEKNCIDFQNCGKIDQIFLAALKHNKNCNRFIRLHNLYQVYKYLGLD